MTALGPALSALARWHAAPSASDLATVLVTLAFAAASSLAVAGRVR